MNPVIKLIKNNIELTVIDLTVIYKNGHTALKNINLNIKGGTICALLGENGSGKSTLFKSIIGIISPKKGLIYLNHLPIKKALKKNYIAYVPQNEDINWNFPVLVDDVVMMGRYGRMSWLRRPSKIDHFHVNKSLLKVDLISFRKRQIGELSGGQRKRVFLARALAQEAKILLLDEPFTGVDNKTEDSIINLLRILRQEGHLILISTHNLFSIPTYCDKIILLKKYIIKYGTLDKIFTKDNLQQVFGKNFSI